MTRPAQPTRRDFMAAGVAGTLGIASLPQVRAASPNDRINVAFIGVGGRGGANLRTITGTRQVNVVALCDVNSRNLGWAAEQHSRARTYADFRRLYDTTKDFDAVVVSTAEHTHAFATLPALKLGKHVYCEKPLTHNIREARIIAEAAAKAGVVTQMGTQIHGMPNYRRVVELIQSGAIGSVTEAHVWVSRAWGRQSPADAKKNQDIVSVTERPQKTMTPPGDLDWDLWIGPAPSRPYNAVYLPGPKWYRWWDFGNGTMSDLGSHWIDLPFWALKFDAPKTIEAFGPEQHSEIAPASMSAVYEYGPRGPLPACKVSWYQGSHKPQIWKDGGIPQWGNGVLFVGDKGMLLSDYGKHVLLPADKFADFKRPKQFIENSPGHHQEWLAACRVALRQEVPSVTQGRSQKPTISATSRFESARSWSGTPPTCEQRTALKRISTSAANPARAGHLRSTQFNGLVQVPSCLCWPSDSCVNGRAWNPPTSQPVSADRGWAYVQENQTTSNHCSTNDTRFWNESGDGPKIPPHGEL